LCASHDPRSGPLRFRSRPYFLPDLSLGNVFPTLLDPWTPFIPVGIPLSHRFSPDVTPNTFPPLSFSRGYSRHDFPSPQLSERGVGRPSLGTSMAPFSLSCVVVGDCVPLSLCFSEGLFRAHRIPTAIVGQLAGLSFGRFSYCFPSTFFFLLVGNHHFSRPRAKYFFRLCP